MCSDERNKERKGKKKGLTRLKWGDYICFHSVVHFGKFEGLIHLAKTL